LTTLAFALTARLWYSKFSDVGTAVLRTPPFLDGYMDEGELIFSIPTEMTSEGFGHPAQLGVQSPQLIKLKYKNKN